MKKYISVAVSLFSAAVILLSVINASAAVYLQDGKYTYKLNDDSTLSWAGYTSETVDDVIVPQSYNDVSVTGVAAFGLENNTSIKTIDFMSAPNLTEIGKYAFSGCISMESVLVPDSITDVDVSAFRGCSGLKDVVFYGNKNIVPVECFYNCTSLSNVRLSAYLVSVQSKAFANCTSLKYLELYDSVKYIAPNAFDGDNDLVLGVYKDSYALQYAEENEIDHIILDGDKTGDVNGDGAVDILDSTEIQKYAGEKIDFTPEQFELGDINKDGYCNVIDALLVQKSVIGAYEIPPIVIRY